MIGSDIKQLNTEIRGGREMDDVIFYILVNLAKSGFERKKPWRKLVTKDTSKSSTPSTTYATSFAIPTNFIMTLPRRTLKLVNESAPTDFIDMTEVPFERWEEYKSTQGYFTIDHKNNIYYVGGIVNKTYTHYFFYISTTTEIDASASWIFPTEFHPALAFEVAAMDELGMDYDDINARQGNANIVRAELIMRGAIKWDEALQRSALGI